MTQQNLIMVLNIHKPGDTTDPFFGWISQQVTIMGYPKVPFRITGVYSREQTNGIPGNLHRMLVAKDMDSLQSSSLDGIKKKYPTTSTSMGCRWERKGCLGIVILTRHRGTPSSRYSIPSYCGGSVYKNKLNDSHRRRGKPSQCEALVWRCPAWSQETFEGAAIYNKNANGKIYLPCRELTR
jgi:hypothetical protein